MTWRGSRSLAPCRRSGRALIVVVVAVAVAALLAAVAVPAWRLSRRVNLVRLLTPAAPRAPLPKLTWDLSASWAVSGVGWPAIETSHLWYVEGPRPLEVRLPEGRQVSYVVQKAQVRRFENGIDGIHLYFDHEPLDVARAHAAALIDEWGAGADAMASLDRWRESRRGLPDADRDPSPTEWLIERKDGRVAFAIQVKAAGTPGRPWIVILSFCPEERLERPGTGPDWRTMKGREGKGDPRRPAQQLQLGPMPPPPIPTRPAD